MAERRGPFAKKLWGTRERTVMALGVINRRWMVILIAAAAIAFTAKLVLALTTYGTNDILTWEADLRQLESGGVLQLYRQGSMPVWHGTVYGSERFNHPPFIISMLRLWGWAATQSGLPLRFWLRLTSAIADVGSLVLVWKILSDKSRPRLLSLLLVALSPASIMISGFHGNTDPIMVMLILLCIYLIEAGRPAWLAGAALGMALNIKIVPILFAPAILAYVRRRPQFVLGAAAVVILGGMPYMAQDPLLIANRVLGYSSNPVDWGFPRLIQALAPGRLSAVYASVAKPLALASILIATFWMNSRRVAKAPLFLQCGFIAFLFLFFAPGFGVQYLAWLVPWCAALTVGSIVFYYVSSTAFLFAAYTLWSGGFPWYLASSLEPQKPRAALITVLLEMACWISIGLVALAYREKLNPTSETMPVKQAS